MNAPAPPSLPDLLWATGVGTRVVVALEPLALVEGVDLALGALRAVAPGTVVTRPLSGPSWPADPAVLQRCLEDAGLREVRQQTTTWDTRIGSAEELLDLVRAVPAVAAALRDLTDEQLGRVRQVLDGMLRERSGGAPGAVLRAEMRVVTGTT